MSSVMSVCLVKGWMTEWRGRVKGDPGLGSGCQGAGVRVGLRDEGERRREEKRREKSKRTKRKEKERKKERKEDPLALSLASSGNPVHRQIDIPSVWICARLYT